jgi:5-hydroxyisourate hydrolase
LAGGISIHVVDVSRGVVATWMRVEVFRLEPERKLIASGIVSAKGLVEEPALAKQHAAGSYEALSHVGAYYRAVGVALPDVPFLDVVPYRFGVSDPEQHYHLPMKVTPWGFSCFRGGA